MSRKYQIKMPKKCLRCNKAAECDALKSMFQKTFDVSRILLDCKAFYIVFCELEERCRVPFGDSEKMKLYHEETESGKRPYLVPAMVINGVLAAELALKALTLNEKGTFECIHCLDKLFYALPDVHKNALSSLIKDKSHQSESTLKTNLEGISNYFIDWRYSFESEYIGYSNFLLEFIHIVCDYAIGDMEYTIPEVNQ